MTTSTNLRSVAAEFALTWPSMYLRLGDDGMLDESTHDTPQHVPLLYFSTDVELLSAEEIGRRLAMLAEPDDFRHIDPAEGLLPFGMEPGGNLYCFHTGAADGDRVPVVLLQNDGPEDERLAPDLSGFVFGEMLRTATEFYEDDYLGEGGPETERRHLAADTRALPGTGPGHGAPRRLRPAAGPPGRRLDCVPRAVGRRASHRHGARVPGATRAAPAVGARVTMLYRGTSSRESPETRSS